MDKSKLSQVVKAIVSEQKSIVGPMAVDLANKVNGLKINGDLSSVDVSGESTKVLADLVSEYQKLFGRASVEACKESVREVGSISSKDLPAILQ